MSARRCGSCTLCCKLLIVPEIKKPQDHWCQYCAIGTGCGIYNDRPTSCVDFNCLWLQGYGSEDMKPDKSKVVMGMTKGGKNVVLYVDKGRPMAWRDKVFDEITKKVVAAGKTVFVVIGDRRIKLQSQSR